MSYASTILSWACLAAPLAFYYYSQLPPPEDAVQGKSAHRGKRTKKKKADTTAPAPAPSVPAPKAAPEPKPAAAAPPSAARADPVRVAARAPEKPRAAAPRGKSAAPTAPPAYEDGALVEARYEDGADWYKATVTSSKPLGGGKRCYAVRYDDGEAETGLPPNRLRPRGGARTPAAGASAPAAPAAAAAPDLEGLVAYAKPGGAAPARSGGASHAADLRGRVQPAPGASRRKKECARLLRENDGDGDESDDGGLYDDVIDVVQSVDDWKKAAPKPLRPKFAKEKRVKKAAPDAEAQRNAEKNRAKKEKAKLKKEALREHFRETL